MSKGLKKYLNLRTLIILSCIVVFILINSVQENYVSIVQENYVSIDDIPEGTLITTDKTPPTTSSQPPSTSSPGPTFPTETPPIPDNGIDYGKNPTIPTQMIPVAIALAIFVFVIFLYFQRKKKVDIYHAKRRVSPSTALSRREKFRTEIKNF
ncbi:MAG: hypothetical protein ACTSSG_12245 [Candidatus Heimdallarchaeaceae archaeon]